MKLKITVLLLFLPQCFTAFSQVKKESTLALYRKNPDKKTFVSEGTHLTFHLYPVSSEGCVSCCPQKLEGYFEYSSKDSVWFDVEYWAKIYNDTNGHHYINSVNYNSFATNYVPEMHAFGYNEIKTVYYNPPARRMFNYSSNVIMVLSGISALVVSPLANINRENGFNGNRYLRMAGWSLAGFGFGLSLNLLTMEREYKVVTN